MAFIVPQCWRAKDSVNSHFGASGNRGKFLIPVNVSGTLHFRCIASDGDGWEHVSVTLVHVANGREKSDVNRCPTWGEMCKVKEWFWGMEDCVVQYHPPASEYVNNHPFCLHLWRPTDGREIPRPPSIMVGVKT